MKTNLYVQESFVNATEHYSYGDGDVYESSASQPGELYRILQREYGRCTGCVYIDTAGKTQKIGWVFVKRARYDDCKETYLQETWVTVHTAKPIRTTTYQYANL